MERTLNREQLDLGCDRRVTTDETHADDFVVAKRGGARQRSSRVDVVQNRLFDPEPLRKIAQESSGGIGPLLSGGDGHAHRRTDCSALALRATSTVSPYLAARGKR